MKPREPPFGWRTQCLKGAGDAARKLVILGIRRLIECSCALRWLCYGGAKRRSRNVEGDEGRKNRYCSSVEGNLVNNKGELQYYDYSIAVIGA